MQFELLRSMDGIDLDAFLEIFRESSMENAIDWYPELPVAQALKKYENGFLAYMQDFFWEEHGALALLSCNDRYVSSLRLYPKDNHVFLMEALETKPDCRNRGFGSQIIRRTISRLEAQYGRIELMSYTGKGNVASQHTHLAAGMTQIRDYWEDEQGEKDETLITYSYQTGGLGTEPVDHPTIPITEDLSAPRIHPMRLHPEPFALIRSGQKTIELRLYDEKRRFLRPGDTIEFTNTATGEVLRATIVQLHTFPSFEELYRALPLDQCGYTAETIHSASPADMEQYYSPEEQARFGVVGIELALKS